MIADELSEDIIDEDSMMLLTQSETSPNSPSGDDSKPQASSALLAPPPPLSPPPPNSDESDDDDSSAASSSPPSPTLVERRALNIQRNAELLQRLGLQHGIVPRQLPPKRKRKNVSETDDVAALEKVDSRPVGMLLSTRAQASLVDQGLTLDSIYSKYPHRDGQLRRLSGCLLTASSQPRSHVPAPIICHGPAGTAKTAIVLDILSLLTSHRTAYIDCQTFEQIASAEQIVQHISKQLRSSRRRNDKQHPHDSQTKQKRRSTGQGKSQQPALDHDRMRSRLSRSAAATTSATAKAKAKQYTTYSLQADMGSLAESTDAPLCAVWNFGRELREQWSRDACFVVVLDHAELLLSIVHNNKNLLSQFLLLPQVFDLNLSIVLVTNSSLLQETRIDNFVPAHISLATIAADVHPILVHFSAYRPGQLKTVLHQPLVRQSIVGRQKLLACGNDDGHGFSDYVYRSFIDMLLQTIHGRTTNIKEIVQLARFMWPTFIDPLLGQQFGKTLETAKQALLSKTNGAGTPVTPQSVEGKIVSLLSRKAHASSRDFESILWDLPNGTNRQQQQELPTLAKYLLLAAYLCQVNHADKDKQLYSIRKSTRRRSQDANRDEQEETAFGANAEKNSSKLIRPRTFPLERVLSVFVSIVGLHLSQTGGDETLDNLGDLGFNNMLATLCETGLLCRHPSQSASDAIRLTEPRYYTTMMDEDAKSLATALNFPLSNFTR